MKHVNKSSDVVTVRMSSNYNINTPVKKSHFFTQTTQYTAPGPAINEHLRAAWTLNKNRIALSYIKKCNGEYTWQSAGIDKRPDKITHPKVYPRTKCPPAGVGAEVSQKE